MKTIKCRFFPPKGYNAITIAWWVIVRSDAAITDKTLRHEKIHFRQQMEMLVFPFFLWYGIEFLFRLVQYMDWKKAYRNISFEREAYANDNDVLYDYTRKHYSFLKYLIA